VNIQKDARFDPAGFIDFPQGFDWFFQIFFLYVSPRDPQPWVEHFLKLTDDP
jgi:hypothetical protein